MKPSNVIRRINAAVLVRERIIEDPETGLPTTQKMTEGELLQIEKLVADAIGINKERGDSLTVSSAPFISIVSDAVYQRWFEKPYMRSIINQAGFVLILGIVILGVVRPLLSRILIPVSVPGVAGVGVKTAVKLLKEYDNIESVLEAIPSDSVQFENLYKREISKSGVPILPSKRARKIPEKIQVSKDDLAELQNTTEQTNSNPVEEAQQEEVDVSLDEMKDQEETVSEASETENQE